VRKLRAFAPSRRRALLLAGAAVAMAVLIVLMCWNVANLIFLQDHSLPSAICWPVVCVLLGSAALLLVPPGRRRRATVLVAFVTVVVLCAGGVGFPVASLFFGRSGDLVDRAVSDDGRYEVRILHWTAVLGEDGWDVVVQRRDGPRFEAAYAGCLFSEVAGYNEIQSVEAGRVRIATDEGGVIDIRFNPDTMRLAERIPADLCAGYA
jgi:hypothetical protein